MIDIIGIFIMALTMSFSHCIGMCGGIVVAYSSRLYHQLSFTKKIMAHLFYNLGRISVYLLIGVVCGVLGYKLSMHKQLSAYFLIILGILLILFAFLYVFVPKFLSYFEFDLYKNSLFKKLFTSLLKSNSISKLYYLGVLNGCLPCGMIYYFAGLALSAGNLLNSVLVMLTFGVATLIPLIIVGMSFSFSQKYHKIFLGISFCFMVGFGIENIYKGVQMLKNNTTNHHNHHGHEKMHH